MKYPEKWPDGTWPPAWNPFEVFLLVLSVVSSLGLLEGRSGSQVLDQRLVTWQVIGWGVALIVGSATALTGIWCYRKLGPSTLLGLYLERTGLILVGGAATIYTYTVLHSAPDIDGVRYAAAIQGAYAAACFYRAWQDHRAIRRAHHIIATSSQGSLNSGAPDGQ